MTAVDESPAAWLREEVDRLEGELRVHGSTLLELFLAPSFQLASGRITAELEAVQLAVEPPLTEATQSHRLLAIYRSDQERVRRPKPPAARKPMPPPPVDPTSELEGLVAAAPTRALAAGAVAPVLLFSAFSPTWWVFLIFLLGGGAVWLLARYARFGVAKVFYRPWRNAWLAGASITALPALLISLIVLFFVAAPVGAQKEADDRRERAAEYLAAADRAVADGDLAGARRALARASDEDDGVDASAVSGRIDRLAAEQKQETARREAYLAARGALDEKAYKRAYDALNDLEGYRDSADLLKVAAAGWASAELARARSALRRGNFETAQDLARQSFAIRKTAAARSLQRRAGRAIERQRLAREHERRAARARAKARREARARARREARERERQSQIEEALPDESDIPAVPSGGTCADTPATDFPVEPGDPRDADGDGIGCES